MTPSDGGNSGTISSASGNFVPGIPYQKYLEVRSRKKDKGYVKVKWAPQRDIASYIRFGSELLNY